ncbi:MAG: cytochrome c3 family protein [Rhodoferax sp.]|nr:cytochrome c3 family protein [Rhodoferax sp.]
MRVGQFVALVLLQAAMTMAFAAPTPTALGDITFERKSKGDEEFAPAVFPHWVHRVKYKCYVCHNKELGFALTRGSVAITMELIDQGKYCGACHKGEPAFGISFETCNRCHRKE